MAKFLLIPNFTKVTINISFSEINLLAELLNEALCANDKTLYFINYAQPHASKVKNE